MKCIECTGKVTELEAKTLMHYRYFSCEHCGEEFLDMEQLHEVAERWRKKK